MLEWSCEVLIFLSDIRREGQEAERGEGAGGARGQEAGGRQDQVGGGQEADLCSPQGGLARSGPSLSPGPGQTGQRRRGDLPAACPGPPGASVPLCTTSATETAPQRGLHQVYRGPQQGQQEHVQLGQAAQRHPGGEGFVGRKKKYFFISRWFVVRTSPSCPWPGLPAILENMPRV